MFFSPKVSYLPTLQSKHLLSTLFLSCLIRSFFIYLIHNFYSHEIQTVYLYIFFPS